MTDREYEIILKLKDIASGGLSKFGKHAQTISQKTTGYFKSITRGVFSLKTAIVSLAGAAGIGLLSKSFVSAASTAEGLRVRLQHLLGSVFEGNKLFKAMSEYAAKVPFEYENIMSSATALAGVMKGGIEEIKKWMPMIGDLASVTGLSIEETTSQVIRMYSAGAAAADMFRERGVLAMMGFKAGVSYTTEETRKMMFDAWNKVGSQFKDATLDLGKTWDGMLSMFSDRWFQFRNKVMDSNVFAVLKEGASKLLDTLGRLDKEGKLDEWAEKVSNAIIDLTLALLELAKSAAYIPEIFLNIKAVWLGIIDIGNLVLEIMIKLGKASLWVQRAFNPTLWFGAGAEAWRTIYNELSLLDDAIDETQLNLEAQMAATNNNIEAMGKYREEIVSTIDKMKEWIEINRQGLEAEDQWALSFINSLNAFQETKSKIIEETQELTKEQIKAANEKEKIELDLHNKIYELTHTELEFKLEMLKQEVMAMANAGAEGLKVIEYYELEKARIIKESNDELLEKQKKAYNKMANEWNSKVESMAATFKDLIVEGLDGEFEDMADRIGKTFKSMVATMVTDWIAGMLKMQENANLNVNVSGSGGGGGIGGLVQGLFGGKNILSSVFQGLGGDLGKGFITNLKNAGMGNLLKYGGAAYNWSAQTGGQQYTAIANMESGAVMLANGEEIAESTTKAAAAQTSAANMTSMAMNKVMEYIPYVAAAYSVYSTVNSAMHDPKKGGSGRGYGQAVLTGFAAGGIIGAVVMAAIYGITSAITKSGKVRRERQHRAAMLTEGYEGIYEHRDEFASIQQMAGAQTSAMRATSYMKYAQNFKNMPGGETAFAVQQQATILHSITEAIGRDAPIVSSQVNMLTKSMDLMFNACKKGAPESAKKLAELKESMKKTMAQDILEAFDHGTKSLRNVRKELQNLGMEDAEMQAQLYSSALAQLFNGTMPKGSVQLERLYEDIKELKKDMEEAEATTKGMTILMTALEKGLELTGEQLKLFRENAENIAKLEWLDVYEALGIEQLELIPETFDSVEDSIEGMRNSLEQLEAQTESFTYWVEGLPDCLGELKDALIITGYAMEAMNSIIKEMIDVVEDLTLLPELIEDFNDAIEENDLGAYVDSLGTLQLYINDLAEAITMLSTVAPGLQKVSFALMGVSVALQSIVLFFQGFQIITIGLKALLTMGDKAAEVAGKVKEWEILKDIILQALFGPLLLVLGVIAKLTEKIPILGGIFELLFKGLQEYLHGVFDETEESYLDMEDFYKKMKALNKQTWKAMTVDMLEFWNNFGKSGFELGLEDMKEEWERYADWLKENWQDLIDRGEFDETTLEDFRNMAMDYYEKMINDFYEGFIKPFEDFHTQINRSLQGMTDEGRTAEDIMAEEAKIARKMWGSYVEGDYEEWLDHAQEMKGLLEERYALEKKRLEEIKAQIKQIENIQKSIKFDFQEIAGGRTGADVLTDIQEAMGKMFEAFHDDDMTEALNLAETLRGLIMERYQLEKEKILDLKDSILDLADQIDSLKDKQKDWSNSIQDMIDEMNGSTGEGAEQIGYWQDKIADLKGQLGQALDLEEREEILGQLQGSYKSLMDVVLGLRGEIGEKSYQMLVDSVTGGLEELKGEGENIYQSEIDVLQAQLDQQIAELEVLTGIQGLTIDMLRADNANETLLANLNAEVTAQLTWLNTILGDVKTDLEIAMQAQLDKMEEIRGHIEWLGWRTLDIIKRLKEQRDNAITDMEKYFDENSPSVQREKNIELSNLAIFEILRLNIFPKLNEIAGNTSRWWQPKGSRQFGGPVREEGMYHLHGNEDVATPNFQSNVMNRLERIEAKQAANSGGGDVYLINASPVKISDAEWKKVAEKVLPQAKNMPRKKLFYDAQVMSWNKGK